jgi:integrase
MPARTARPARRPFGSVRELPSGRFQARHPDPTAARGARVEVTAPELFRSEAQARVWLEAQQRAIAAGTWTPPPPSWASDTRTFEAYARGWLAGRELRPRTRDHYTALLDDYLIPAWGPARLDKITPADVRAWWSRTLTDKPTMRAHAYGLLRTILGTAVADDVIPANPCRIRGAGNAKRASRTRPATPAELDTITETMPDRLRLAVQLAAWCALRFGELTELRRGDVDLRRRTLTIARGVVRVPGQPPLVGDPKTEAGRRTVSIPPHLVPAVRAHLADHVAARRDALLFPAADGVSHLAPATLYRSWYKARDKAGRPDLRFHDLRHTGAVMAAEAGATLPDLMARLGHTTAGAALRYQHTAADRDRALADALSARATAPREATGDDDTPADGEHTAPVIALPARRPARRRGRRDDGKGRT